MSWMIMSYGLDVEDPVDDIDTLQEAKRVMDEMVQRWCDEYEVDIELTDYSKEDTYFEYGVEEKGVAIYEIFEVPEFKNEYDETMWELELKLNMIQYASADYKYSLEDCMVEDYVEEAKTLLHRLYQLENP